MFKGLKNTSKLLRRNKLLTPRERLIKFGKYELILPSNLHPDTQVFQKLIPQHILTPDYSNINPINNDEEIYINSAEEIEGIKKAAKLASEILRLAISHAKEGVTTIEIDDIVYDAIIKNNAYPSPLNYKNYPNSICTSINNVLCHGALKSGDIVNIDITVYLNGFHGDTSRTVLIGDVDQKGRDLVRDNEECLQLAIQVVKPGEKFAKIGEIISEYASKRGYSVDRNFCGHGIGRRFHQAPLVYHFINQEAYEFKSGMVFTIEPIFVQGDNGFLKWPDQWTVVSKDGSRSSQCEHTILVTDNGHEVLTR